MNYIHWTVTLLRVSNSWLFHKTLAIQQPHKPLIWGRKLWCQSVVWHQIFYISLNIAPGVRPVWVWMPFSKSTHIFLMILHHINGYGVNPFLILRCCWVLHHLWHDLGITVYDFIQAALDFTFQHRISVMINLDFPSSKWFQYGLVFVFRKRGRISLRTYAIRYLFLILKQVVPIIFIFWSLPRLKDVCISVKKLWMKHDLHYKRKPVPGLLFLQQFNHF